MSIERYYIGTGTLPSGSFFQSDKGQYVLYADHVAAVSHAVQAAEIQAVAETEAAERARIKAALTERVVLLMAPDGEEQWIGMELSDLLAIINGEQ